MDKKAQNKAPLIKRRINDIPQTIEKDIEDPLVSDPPVPNRAHTEMRKNYPPEFPEE